jgi:hypothetical protein
MTQQAGTLSPDTAAVLIKMRGACLVDGRTIPEDMTEAWHSASPETIRAAMVILVAEARRPIVDDGQVTDRVRLCQVILAGSRDDCSIEDLREQVLTALIEWESIASGALRY